MKHINNFINEKLQYILTERTEVDEIFDVQDRFRDKMIKMWKSNKDLKPFDLYFKWKNHDITTGEWRKTPKDDIKKMIFAARNLSNEEYEKDNYNGDLIEVLDAIEMELINIIQLFK